jgi:hypothetical protein
MLIILAIAIIIRSEVETWPLRCALYENFFNHKTKTEKRLRVLIITKSSCTADTLFSLLRLTYQKSAVVALGILKRKIRFANNEYWYITSYLEDELESLDLNMFDKIVISSDLPINAYQKIADKTLKHSVLRVCSMVDVINAITNKEVENHA